MGQIWLEFYACKLRMFFNMLMEYKNKTNQQKCDKDICVLRELNMYYLVLSRKTLPNSIRNTLGEYCSQLLILIINTHICIRQLFKTSLRILVNPCNNPLNELCYCTYFTCILDSARGVIWLRKFIWLMLKSGLTPRHLASYALMVFLWLKQSLCV